ncbi:MAG: glycoside hydrolase [Pirellulaceae bacterium]|nr:glycoside hydrolase [Pirellulaceae bacterium]
MSPTRSIRCLLLAATLCMASAIIGHHSQTGHAADAGDARSEQAGSQTPSKLTAGNKPAEGRLEPFLGEPRFDTRKIFAAERFPNVVVTTDGTVLATWGSKTYRVRRSEDGGETWGAEIVVQDEPAFHGGGALVDEKRGDVLVFVHETHPPSPLTVYRSADHGKTWKAQEAVIGRDIHDQVPAMHMSEVGIILRHGPHAGRLLRPARVYGVNRGYNTAIYSDDGGRTWHSSAPFPENGTGEGAVAELSDGRIYYNSRSHAAADALRRIAWSHDGGRTWQDLSVSPSLPDGPRGTAYGCMGGLTRLPVQGADILVYSNLDEPTTSRRRITVWTSLDGGKTWPVKRLVYDGSSAYSSLAAGRPGTPSEGWIYLQYEGGPGGGGQLARFNLAWLLAGEATRDGQVPESLLP